MGRDEPGVLGTRRLTWEGGSPMSVMLGIALWMVALVCVLALAGGVRRGDRLRERERALEAGGGSDAQADVERSAAPLTASRRTPARTTRRATG